MKKKIFTKAATMALAGTMILSLAACGNTNGAQAGTETSAQQTVTQEETDTQEVTDISAGGWEANSGALSIESNAAAKAAFEKAVEGLEGYEYEPIALLGTQVVAGTNYSILARGTAVVPDAEPVYEIVVVYEDLEGNAEITGSKTLLGNNEEGIVGGFEANAGEYDLAKNADIKAVFDKAMEGLDGSDYEAVAYFGSQVVQGTNYLALMRVTPVVPDAEPQFSLVTVYEDLEGNVSMQDDEEISLGAENDISSTENVRIPDPFEAFSSIEEAAAAAGFEMTVPDAPAGYQNVVYRVDQESQMLEVIYLDNDTEEAKEGYRIRKAVGSDDISGDYNSYNETSEVTVSSNTVTLKGNDGKVFVAIWTSGDYTYAIDVDMDGQGLSADEVTRIAEATK